MSQNDNYSIFIITQSTINNQFQLRFTFQKENQRFVVTVVHSEISRRCER